MSKLSVLEKHIEFKKTSVKSEEKLKDIRRYLEKFLESSKKPLSKFNEEDVAKFLNSLQYSIRTINDIKAYLKVFIKWHYNDWSSRFRNLEKLLKMQKAPRAYEPEDLIGIDEIKKIVAKEKDLMWKVYWMVFFYGGFRPSECARLTWNQVYFEPEGVIIKVHATKTKKDFYKSLPRDAEHLLKEWKKYNNSNLLFPSPIKEGESIQSRTICQRLKRISKKAINREVVPYGLRHSIATILYKDDKRKDTDTANQLGHNKSMKEVYMSLNEKELKTKARNIWLRVKKLSKEDREEFEKRIKALESFANGITRGIEKTGFEIITKPGVPINKKLLKEAITKLK